MLTCRQRVGHRGGTACSQAAAPVRGAPVGRKPAGLLTRGMPQRVMSLATRALGQREEVLERRFASPPRLRVISLISECVEVNVRMPQSEHCPGMELSLQLPSEDPFRLDRDPGSCVVQASVQRFETLAGRCAMVSCLFFLLFPMFCCFRMYRWKLAPALLTVVVPT